MIILVSIQHSVFGNRSINIIITGHKYCCHSQLAMMGMLSLIVPAKARAHGGRNFIIITVTILLPTILEPSSPKSNVHLVPSEARAHHHHHSHYICSKISTTTNITSTIPKIKCSPCPIRSKSTCQASAAAPQGLHVGCRCG